MALRWRVCLASVSLRRSGTIQACGAGRRLELRRPDQGAASNLQAYKGMIAWVPSSLEDGTASIVQIPGTTYLSSSRSFPSEQLPSLGSPASLIRAKLPHRLLANPAELLELLLFRAAELGRRRQDGQTSAQLAYPQAAVRLSSSRSQEPLRCSARRGESARS